MDDKKIEEAIAQFKNKRVAVVGDIMLDKYTFGEVKRISEEASVPILKKISEKFVLGGAGNVAANLGSLGVKVYVFGVIGMDKSGKTIKEIFAAQKINFSGVVEDESRMTTVKHRLVSDSGHQLLRVDDEAVKNLDAAKERDLADRVISIVGVVDAIIFSDYAKGVFSKELVKAILKETRAKKKMVFADIKPQHKDIFIGADLIAPNLQEAKEMTGKDDAEEMGVALVDYFGADVMITRGGGGISVFSRKDRACHHIPGRKIKVFDVSGAGDTAIAVASLGLTAGLDLVAAAELANAAGSLVVQKPGTATLSLEELSSVFDWEKHIELVDIVPKAWGYEKWLENNDKYCCKLLSLNKGFQCSLHYHKNKDETFFITSGLVRLELSGEVMHLRPGAFVRIPPGSRHRFTGIEDSMIMEVSTHHEEADSYRIENSRKVEGIDLA